MLFNCSCDPKKASSIALFMLPFGLLVVSCGIAWPHIAPWLHLPATADDSIQGFCLGMGITLEVGSVALMRRFGNRPTTN